MTFKVACSQTVGHIVFSCTPLEQALGQFKSYKIKNMRFTIEEEYAKIGKIFLILFYFMFIYHSPYAQKILDYGRF